MRKTLAIVSGLLLVFVLSGCCMSHSFTPATCAAPATCTKCGEVEGEALGHAWGKATCESPIKCTTCGMTNGDALGHKWEKETCISPKTCSVCGKMEGDIGDHSWQEATCLSAKKCSVCELTEGEPLEHVWVEATCSAARHCELCNTSDGEPLEHAVYSWDVVEQATCTSRGKQVGTCTLCNNEIEQKIEKDEHELDEWEVYYMPTDSYDGQMIQKCTVCEKTINTRGLSKQDSEYKTIYKNQCQNISYTELARNPNKYYDEYVRFSGTVVQVCSEAAYKSDYSTYRVATSSGYDDVVFVSIYNYGQPRILEDDYITFYGYFDGLITYETVMGASVTIPSVFADIIE